MSLVPSPEIIERARAHGVDLQGELGQKLGRYLGRLIAKNQEFNLTAIDEVDEAWERHILDSLSLVPELKDLPPGSRVVDVGSGGGLPALPLAITLPSLDFTLLEATGKKAQFLAETAALLKLEHVHVVTDRAETFGHTPERQRFDIATARAVSRLPVLLELTLPLVRVGGRLLAIKGEQAALEVEEAKTALTILKAQVKNVRRTETGTVLEIEKVGSTPSKYPRRPGEPKRNPLL